MVCAGQLLGGNMQKYIQAAESFVKIMEMVAVLTILTYGIICFERWQRPEGIKKIIESVDTNKASV
jgi:hypothetical protein